MKKEKGIKTGNLNIGYDSDLIRDITLSVQPGSIVTLIGPNGCGKTTLLKTLTGALKERGGVILLNGDDRSKLSAAETARRLSVMMTYKLKPSLMTCREVVEVGRYPYTGRLGILSDEDKRKVKEAMEWTNVSDLADTFFQNISDGQKQRVLLARAICQEPEILVLDEPTSFLDIRHKLDILQRIVTLCKERKIAVLMSLHELEIARNLSDTVVAMGEGRVQRIGTPEEVFREDFIRELYHLEGMDTGILGSMPWETETGEDGAGDMTAGKPGDVEPASGEHYAGVAGSDRKADGKAKVIMIQGTMSNAGKSLLAAGLCRIFSDDGFRVAPFKSQNMALNSYITKEGLEMGRAQVMQAECARTEPLAAMNPILLKPSDDVGSQVIVNGKVVGNMKAMEYFRRKKEFVKDIEAAYNSLAENADIIVVEGAGSPVELNLLENDVVNMGLAKMIDAPVLLVGDIDRGGIFAQLIGTLDLLEEPERRRVKGIIVNKFRGDGSLFKDGIRMLEEKGNTRVVGVVPYLQLSLDDEDSLSERFQRKETGAIDIAVIRFGHISNFTDFDPFDQLEDVSIRYVSSVSELGTPDLIILPGTKNTIADLQWMKEQGLAKAVTEMSEQGTSVLGICGGYQMLGRSIEDPDNVEGGGKEQGLGLLPVDTVLGTEKTRTHFTGKVTGAEGILEALAGTPVEGYEIHMGRTEPCEDLTEFTSEQTGFCRKNIYGTYLHGFFDGRQVLEKVIRCVAAAGGKNWEPGEILDHRDFKENQYDMLARELRACLDMNYIYGILGIDRGQMESEKENVR
ncbi:MAG: cobyric acid synthase [Eubacterium sp.]|nr:cobyric acid synthase [Eubacterium sp.]